MIIQYIHPLHTASETTNIFGRPLKTISEQHYSFIKDTAIVILRPFREGCSKGYWNRKTVVIP